jgi:hypothetical protein
MCNEYCDVSELCTNAAKQSKFSQYWVFLTNDILKLLLIGYGYVQYLTMTMCIHWDDDLFEKLNFVSFIKK